MSSDSSSPRKLWWARDVTSCLTISFVLRQHLKAQHSSSVNTSVSIFLSVKGSIHQIKCAFISEAVSENKMCTELLLRRTSAADDHCKTCFGVGSITRLTTLELPVLTDQTAGICRSNQWRGTGWFPVEPWYASPALGTREVSQSFYLGFIA